MNLFGSDLLGVFHTQRACYYLQSLEGVLQSTTFHFHSHCRGHRIFKASSSCSHMICWEGRTASVPEAWQTTRHRNRFGQGIPQSNKFFDPRMGKNACGGGLGVELEAYTISSPTTTMTETAGKDQSDVEGTKFGQRNGFLQENLFLEPAYYRLVEFISRKSKKFVE